MNPTGSSGLSIGYNGSFLSKSDKEKCHKSGVVLTRGGRVYTRDRKQDPWDRVETPRQFFFRDHKSETTYLVDKDRKSIEESDAQGRVLDCTDRIIYEMSPSGWQPVCDLSTQASRTIVRCHHLAAASTAGSISSRQVDCRLLNQILKQGNCAAVSLPGYDLNIPFEVLGCNAKVLDDISEIPSQLVDLQHGFLSEEAVAPGSCAVLTYETCWCDETVMVAQLFIREAFRPRFSAKCGQFVPPGAPVAAVVATPLPDPLCPEMDPCLVPIVSVDGMATNLYQVVNWMSSMQTPPGQFSDEGVWTVPQSGDYNVKAELYLCSDRRLTLFGPNNDIRSTYFVLVKYPAGADPAVTPGVIEVCAPIQNNLAFFGTTTPVQDRLESVHASLDIGLHLNVGEQLVIYYVEDVGLSFTRTLPPLEGDPNQGYRLIRCASTFGANYLG